MQTLPVYGSCVLGDSPWDPALLSSEFWEPAYLILQHLQPAGLFLLKTAEGCRFHWPNYPRALRTRSQLHSYRQAMVMRQRTTCESIRQRETVSLLHKEVGNTQVPQKFHPAARRNCQREISLGPSEHL